MPRSSRTRSAAIRASFGRAERLQRENAGGRTTKPAPSRKQPGTGRAPQKNLERVKTERPAASTVSRSTARERKLTALDTVLSRVDRARATSERQRQQRLKDQTRSAFNRDAERRRDTTRRTEHDRKRQDQQKVLKRVEESRRRTGHKLAERKRADMRRAFAREAENRKAAAAALRQKEFERRAAVEIEREQKRRAADQQTEHRRQTSEVRDRHKAETRSFRSNEDAAMERHHGAIKRIDGAEDRALADFDGRRGGLVGWLAERVPGKQAENDRQREEIQKRFESERLTQHRDFEALKERQFEVAQRARLQQAQERKDLMELHRDDRTGFAERHAADRPKLIEDRARVLDHVDRQQEQERERERPEPVRENVRPSGDFSGAAPEQPREQVSEPAPKPQELTRDQGREMELPSRAFERAL